MMAWLTSKVATSLTVMVIAASFMGLFDMQVDYYRTLELEDLADSVTELVTEVDLLGCEAEVVLNWTSSSESHGLPREFHGDPYIVQFTEERPYVVWRGIRVVGKYFPSNVLLLDKMEGPIKLLEISSVKGFVIDSRYEWADWGLNQVITVRPLG